MRNLILVYFATATFFQSFGQIRLPIRIPQSQARSPQTVSLEGTWQAASQDLVGDVPSLIVIYHRGTAITGGEPPLETQPSWPRRVFSGTYSGKARFKIKIDPDPSGGNPKDGEVQVKDANTLTINGNTYRRLSTATNTARPVKPPELPSLADLRAPAPRETTIIDLDGTWEAATGGILDFQVIRISITHQGSELTAEYSSPQLYAGHVAFHGRYSGQSTFMGQTETNSRGGPPATVKVTVVDPDNLVTLGSRPLQYHRVSTPALDNFPCDQQNSHHLTAQATLARADAAADARRFSDALCWASIAAEANEWMGQLIVGAYLRKGLGTPADPQRAFTWITLSARNALPFAEQILAEMYLNGEGTQPDPAQAATWKAKARRDNKSLQEVEQGFRNMNAALNAYGRGHSETHVEMQRQLGRGGIWVEVPVAKTEWVPAPVDSADIRTPSIPPPPGFRAARYVIPRPLIELGGAWETTVNEDGRSRSVPLNLRQEGPLLVGYESMGPLLSGPRIFSGNYSGEEEKFNLRLVSRPVEPGGQEIPVVVEDSDHVMINGREFRRTSF
jgi:hypothetical protein